MVYDLVFFRIQGVKLEYFKFCFICNYPKYSIYLNTVEEGGETEFLYQSQRVKPVKGRIVIWPAGFPYVHRGNPPLSGEKYIVTSWISFK